MIKHDTILLEHGGGGLLTHDLIAGVFLPLFRNPCLNRLEDSAVLELQGQRLCFTTDSYVVSPLFFPGGDIGSLAVHGTINDLAMSGGSPLALSCGFIIEEGFPLEQLRRICSSMAAAAQRAGVQIVTGDTKVVPKGTGDGVYINTSGIGIIPCKENISVEQIQSGDVIIVNGTIGDHGAAILSVREGLGLQSPLLSDSAPLNGLVSSLLKAGSRIHCMRDATRGGLGAILAEIAGQSGFHMSIAESSIPVHEQVRGVCEMLGFDPLFLANEGKMAVFCSPDDAGKVLAAMQAHEYGRNAAVIGRVHEKGQGRLILNTIIGGERVIDLPVGELVPRIC